MKVVTKKSKTRRMSEMGRVEENKAAFSTVYFVENIDIPSTDIQALRKLLRGKVLFVKKTMFQKMYPSCDYPNNYFLVFGEEGDKKIIEDFEYPDYGKAGDKAVRPVSIKAGVVREKKLHGLLKNLATEGSNKILQESLDVCKEGDVLDSEQAQILRIRGERVVRSHMAIIDIKPAKEI